MADGSDFPVFEYGDKAVEHVLDVYEDMRCSYCATLEHELGGAITRLADEGVYRIVYHVANFLDRGDEHGGSTNSLAALAAAAEQDAKQFTALRAAIFEYRLANGTDGLADLDVIRGIVARTPGVDFLAVGKTINEDRLRLKALEAGPAALASLRAAWTAAELPGRAGTPAAFLDGRPVEVLTEAGDPLSPAEFEANVRAAL
ncbi:MAG TPA: thioredoxin domain-containing protein [Actinospica sp.]|nr:thioredoxin domain-containing protein [Actinospica sp.]